MASGIFAILDDIGALMDDVAMASKIATQKTAGILGDDLAVNAEKATGFLSSRELPVLWSITKGSFINKLIIIPIALFLNLKFPAAINVILVLGGLFLAYEGVEKIIEFLFHREKKGKEVIAENNAPDGDNEKSKISAAIRTDFILSIEIVIISLSTVVNEPLVTQILTVTVVGILATIGVYGIVAMIVRMDDTGYKLIKKSKGKGPISKLGQGLVNLLPIIIKVLGVVGTIALILVSGGILVHNLGNLHHYLPNIPSIINETIIGLLAGIIVVGLISGSKSLIKLVKKSKA